MRVWGVGLRICRVVEVLAGAMALRDPGPVVGTPGHRPVPTRGVNVWYVVR